MKHRAGKGASVMKKGKTVLIIGLVLVLLVLAAGIALLSNQVLVGRVLEVRRDSLLAEVCNPSEYRWIDRKFGSAREYEYIRLYVPHPEQFRRGQFFAAVTRPGEESSSPPGIGARWVFR